jgi:hypothetical protein
MYLSRQGDSWQLANIFALALVGPNGELYSGTGSKGLGGATNTSEVPDL